MYNELFFIADQTLVNYIELETAIVVPHKFTNLHIARIYHYNELIIQKKKWTEKVSSDWIQCGFTTANNYYSTRVFLQWTKKCAFDGMKCANQTWIHHSVDTQLLSARTILCTLFGPRQFQGKWNDVEIDDIWGCLFSPYSADHDYCHFLSVLLVDQITVIGNEMYVYTSRFANICAQIKQIWVIFSHLKLWVAVARHNFKWLKI